MPKGRITKVILAERPDGGAIAASSFQEPEDPFSYGANGLVEPPYNPAKLLDLSEKHTTHGAALEQKTADIAGTGWHWEKKVDTASDEQQAQLEEWFRGLADPTRDESTAEILTNAWLDLETMGHGMIEIGRDGEGKMQRIYPSAAHMVRFHKSGKKLAQGKVGKRVWFKRWTPGDKNYIDRKKGNIGPRTEVKMPGNELFILRRATKRGGYYGVPGYVSAIGWIALSIAARDDNIHFFNNRREPRWAIILNNLEDEGGDLEEQLRHAFSTSLKDPHRNLFIPIEGDGKIDFKQLTSDAKDVSFDKLQERAGSEILVAHRMPPDRLGAVRVGPLGGNTTVAASRVYKEAVVTTSQGILSERINRLIAAEGPIPPEQLEWAWAPEELDLTEEAEDVTVVTNAFTSNIMRLDEARKKLKLPPVGKDEGGDSFFFELTAGNPAASAAAAATAGARTGGSLAALAGLSKAERDLARRIIDVLKPEPRRGASS